MSSRINAVAAVASLVDTSGLKRKEVAIALGISEPALSVRLNIMNNMTLESIDSICKVLGYKFELVFTKE